jgi:hypothetical protein
VDFQLPERFGLEYVAADGSRQRPVMIHRGAFGAMERMIAYLIEHYAGAFPTWLAPVQVAVLPIADAQVPYAKEVAGELRRCRVRVDVDERSERVGKKIAEAQARKISDFRWDGETPKPGFDKIPLRKRGFRPLPFGSAGNQTDAVKVGRERMALEAVRNFFRRAKRH